MLVQGKYLYYEDDKSEAFDIRRQVFHVEQGVPLEEEFDEIDDLAVHVIVFTSDEPRRAVATGRVVFDGDNYKIGRVAVIKKERGKKYGDFVVRMLANKAFLAGAEEIHIDAQVVVAPFYEKIGFIAYGKEFEEAGIKHIPMKLISGSLCKECNNSKKII